MTELLLKLYVKDYKNTTNSKVRQKYGFLGSTFGLISNFILFVSKNLCNVAVFAAAFAVTASCSRWFYQEELDEQVMSLNRYHD